MTDIKRPLEPERSYCPKCRAERWEYRIKDDGTCKECGEPVRDRWPLTAYAKHLAGMAIAIGIAGAIFAGPIIYIVYGLMQGRPLFGTETVVVTKTITKPTGVVTQVMPVFVLWVLIALVAAAGVTGGLPRR